MSRRLQSASFEQDQTVYGMLTGDSFCTVRERHLEPRREGDDGRDAGGGLKGDSELCLFLLMKGTKALALWATADGGDLLQNHFSARRMLPSVNYLCYSHSFLKTARQF